MIAITDTYSEKNFVFVCVCVCVCGSQQLK